MMRRIVPALVGLVLTAQAPAPAPLLRFTGQLLDVRNGYVYFTTGDAFKTVAVVRVTDYATGKPTVVQPRPRMYARATFDPQTHQVLELAITTQRLPADKSFADVKQYAVAATTPQPAAELAPKAPITGRDVAVAFVIEVPPTTAISDNVYISTDASGWDPRAILTNRVDAAHYRVVRRFASGSTFHFRITRGSWQSVEVSDRGLEQPAYSYSVPEADAQERRVYVRAWSDARSGGQQSQQAQPGAIPTPFNPNPFPPGAFPPGAIKPPGGATSPPNTPANPH